jgi:hypothetical protein
MEKIANLYIEGRRFHCLTSIDGKFDSAMSLPEKDYWDIPNLFKGLKEYGYKIRFYNPSNMH